jgi:para-aminobenzoate synthetase/4-amino-4-deoxychorismate lyase
MDGIRVILDFPSPARNGAPGRLVLAPPDRIITADHPGTVRAALREAVRSAAAGATVAGFLGYEAAPAFDTALVTHAAAGPAPLLWFGVFDRAGVHSDATPHFNAHATALPDGWRADTTRADYDAAIAAIRDAIAAGDVYQVNHTLRFGAPCDLPPLALYDALVAAGHGRYHALIETPDWAVISASPELFIDVGDGIVTTRPMKGTARRGRWLEEDRSAADALAHSAKDRAENLMIVDLLRNDLGRIAQFGSVDVTSMYDVETYPTVHQLTSTITARQRADCTLDDVFAAMFPCGSVTGAPKIAAMRQIAALEHTPRGPYCGAVGIMRADGSATFNVAIRTVLLDRTTARATYGSGGGITWDSSAAAEYDEAVAKAALLTEHVPAFELIETLRLDDGTLHRLDLHCARLRASCAYWDFDPLAPAAALRALEQARAQHAAGSWRVRLVVGRDASARVTTTPLDAPAGRIDDDAAPLHVALARAPVHSRDRLLCHKTTARGTYHARRADHADAFDVLLFNEHGCITEFTIGNVVCDIDDLLLTPPRSAGLLDGVFREQLLRDRVITERDITVADARRARRMWLINSVREWVAVRLG